MALYMSKTLPEDVEVSNTLSALAILFEQNEASSYRLKTLILRLANRISNLKVCDDHEISAVVKMLLKNSIDRKEVSSRYIHYALPGKFKRKYVTKRETISDSNCNVDQSAEFRDSIRRKGNLWEIRYWLDRERLLRNLNILGPPVSKKNVCFRCTIDLASQSIMDHSMGYGSDSIGFFWLPLWKNES